MHFEVLAAAFRADSILLARHGQTEWNRDGKRQGQLDSALTDLGREQAVALAKAVVPLDVDAIFASPLGRAAATAAVCGGRIGLPVVTIEELAEVDHGQMAGLTNDEIEQRFPGELGRRASDKYLWQFPGGESYADADRRANLALCRVAAANAERPLIVSHEMIGRMLLRQLLDTDPAAALLWKQPHHVIYRIDPRGRSVTQIHVERPGATAV